jgi:hypothetical protein
MCTVCEALRGPQLVAISGQVAERLADGMGDNWSQVRLRGRGVRGERCAGSVLWSEGRLRRGNPRPAASFFA